MGVESDDVVCSGRAATGVAVQMMPEEEAGEGAGDVAASDGIDAGAEVGVGQCRSRLIDCIVRGTV